MRKYFYINVLKQYLKRGADIDEIPYLDLDQYDEQTKAEERVKVLDEVLGLKPQIYTWLIKREKEGYGTTLGECTDKIFEEIEKVFKSHKKTS